MDNDGSESEDGTFKGWSMCAQAMSTYDDHLVQGWKEELDTLLLLAGLFSAVLTAFALQSYAMLQPDTQQSSMLYLQVIATQVANGTSLPLPPISFTPTESAIRVNAVWFAGLVLSLVAALLGILVKQWLREYSSRRLMSPRDAVRMRQFRHSGLLAWRVADILALLPLLIQASLVLFLVGLLDLLWATTVRAVAAVSTVLVAVSILLVLASLVMPLVHPACPYKTPLALQFRSFYLQTWTFLVGAWARARRCPHDATRQAPDQSSWWDADTAALAAAAHAAPHAPAGHALEYAALRWAWATLPDDGFQAALVPCVSSLPARTRLRFVLAELARHASCTPDTLLLRLRAGPRGAGDASLYRGLLRAGHAASARTLALVLDVLPDAGAKQLVKDESARALFGGAPPPALSRLDLLHAIHPLLNAYALTGRQQYITRTALTRRVFDVLLDVLDYQGQPYGTIAAVFSLLSTFDHLFWKHVTPDAVSRMLRAINRNLVPDQHPTVAVYPLHVVHPYEGALLAAAGAALHYLFAPGASTSTADLGISVDDHCALPALLRAMEIHVRACTRARRAYMLQSNTRVSWCWALRRLAARDPALCVGLIAAIVESDRAGLISQAESGPFHAIVGILKKAGLQGELDDATVVKPYAAYTRRTMTMDIPLPVGRINRTDTERTIINDEKRDVPADIIGSPH